MVKQCVRNIASKGRFIVFNDMTRQRTSLGIAKTVLVRLLAFTLRVSDTNCVWKWTCKIHSELPEFFLLAGFFLDTYFPFPSSSSSSSSSSSPSPQLSSQKSDSCSVHPTLNFNTFLKRCVRKSDLNSKLPITSLLITTLYI